MYDLVAILKIKFAIKSYNNDKLKGEPIAECSWIKVHKNCFF